MSSRRAIVTLAVGEQYARFWRQACERNWRAYGDRHGYDVICIDQPLDPSPRARERGPTWQKLLVLSQPFSKRYEQIVWMDADFLLNPLAPSVADAVAPERVGAVDEYATPTRELYRVLLRRLYEHWEAAGVPFVRGETAAGFYEAFGLPARHEEVVQAGLMVLSPRHHRDLLEHIYYTHEDPRRVGDMRAVSFELLEAGAVDWIDHRFNYPWLLYAAEHFPNLLGLPDHPRVRETARAALHDVHFLHFAGAKSELALAGAGAPQPRRAVMRAGNAEGPLTTPVALLLYARPDTTRRLLAAVRAARPERLLVVTDAAPPDDPDAASRCSEVRRLVHEGVDWDCEVTTDFAERHLGLKRRVESGLDWVFDSVGEAIVLEDDCIPHHT
ncbi:MAG: hypothetical protein QOK31_1300, partial [Solirubrobacteraceae bacterium]|nr:hypothetical protein [Solirubrobacteraceae bacterium]